jgi:hypothetical protein
MGMILYNILNNANALVINAVINSAVIIVTGE